MEVTEDSAVNDFLEILEVRYRCCISVGLKLNEDVEQFQIWWGVCFPALLALTIAASRGVTNGTIAFFEGRGFRLSYRVVHLI